MQHQVARHHGQFRKSGQHANSGNVTTDLSATETAWKLWELMGEVYSNRWTQKNGAAPSKLWIAQIGAMTEQQIRLVCRQCMDRCRAGETWPPDLAEFVALISESGANPFGLTVDAVMEEYRRLTQGELKRLAERQLTKWAKHVGNGMSVPPVRRQLEGAKHPQGPTPIERLKQEYERRKAAGFI
ncbi:replication protein [Escherichia coli]|uniref:Replication protein n=2 Tax=Escherichia coli TaxID=562 RepID=A0A2W8GLV2_ECOLX|nr:replication protein [Escherichia coli]